MTRPLLATLALLLTASASAPIRAQTLARPGWAGSGMAVQSWSKHAVLYEINTRTFEDTNADGTGDLKGITQRLDYIQSLGIDAILLEPLAPAASETPGQPIDPALGTLDDFDDLSLQASRLNIRILLDLPTPDPALARFWLARGVAGFHLHGTNTAAIQAIRKLLPSYVGQRILITDADVAASSPSKPSPNELLLDNDILKIAPAPGANAAPQLRSALEQSQRLLRNATPIIATDASDALRSADRFTPENAKILATVLLLNRSVALIYAGQELGLTSPPGTVMMPWGPPPAPPVAEAPPEPVKPPPPPPEKYVVPEKYVPYVAPVKPVAPPKPAPLDPSTAAGQEADPNSLLNFYRQLTRLHHGNNALRDGEEITLNHDDLNALIWVRRPAAPTLLNPAIVIVCNLGDKPLVLPLKAETTRLQLRGSFLRPILRSDNGAGSLDLSPVTLPPHTVFIGDLRF